MVMAQQAMMPEQATVAIMGQLGRILDSATFSGATRVRAFLEFVVTETVRGRKKFLKAYTIALEVLGRDQDFDPNNDSIVRVEAGRLRDRLARYYYEEGGDDPVRIEIPKGGYAPVFSFKDKQVEASAVTESVASPAPASRLSVGVLPFVNLSDDPQQKFFCDGIVEEINAALHKFSCMRIAARSALVHFERGTASLRQLANELKLRFVLEGSVRRQGDHVRVTAKLVNPADGASLWAETYDRALTASNMFAIQDDIAISVAAAVAAPSGAIASFDLEALKRRAPANFSAYEAVLTAYEDTRQPTPAKHAQIRELLEAAVRAEPHYGEAWAMLSIYYMYEHRFELNPRTEKPPLDRALAAARRGVSESRNNALAWKNLAKVHYERCEFDLFEEAGDRALSLNPAHPEVLADFGAHLWMTGVRERGVELVEQALALHPQPPGRYYFTIVHEHFYNGRYEEALATALKLNCPELSWQHLLFTAIYGNLGRLNEAKFAADRFQEQYPNLLNRLIAHVLERPHPPGLLDKLLDGLRAAGLEPPAAT